MNFHCCLNMYVSFTSLKLWKCGGWILEHPLEDLRALVHLAEASFAELKGIWLSHQSLSVLDEGLFKLLDKLIRSSSAPSEVQNNV